MRAARKVSCAVACAALAGLAMVACGGSATGPAAASAKPGAVGAAKDPSKWPADDRSMCDWRNHPDLEVSETAGPGAIKPNVRRVYKDIGEGENRHKVLVCREIDTNLDGVKDVVRMFNAKGEANKENTDTNFDGKLDTWATYVSGRMSEEDEDTNFDGAPDLWKYYVDGKLSRVKRDRNFDGKPDVWEIYSNGRLERMGIDDTYDGHVDRWDRDESVHADDSASSGGDAGAGTNSKSPGGAAADAGK
jgi:hypothetical protein